MRPDLRQEQVSREQQAAGRKLLRDDYVNDTRLDSRQEQLIRE
jgi:hypothetical protein